MPVLGDLSFRDSLDKSHRRILELMFIRWKIGYGLIQIIATNLFYITGFDLRKLQCPRLDCYVDLYDLKSSNNTMKFDIFSRKKFKCNICVEKFKTQRELTEHKHMRHGATS